MLATSLSVSESGMSNPQLASSTGAAVTNLSGSAILSRSTQTSSTDLSYRGGASFYSSGSDPNMQTHQFGIAETLGLRRWTVTLADNFSYLAGGPGYPA